MEFIIDEADNLNVPGSTIAELLIEVYVSENYVEPEVAEKLFEPTLVKSRGIVICVIENQSLTLAGCVIVVPFNSPACKIAKENESEMHLLCVNTKYRKKGLGKLLVKSAIDMAINNGNKKMILWTQQSMKSAQRLYSSMGFIHVKNITRNNREFLVYEKTLKSRPH